MTVNDTNPPPFETQSILDMGYSSVTEVQKLAMPILATGKSLHALAPTGSGKTLAFLLPLMRRIQSDLFETQLLILVPTRELGFQIAQVAERVSRHFGSLPGRSLMVRTAFGGQKLERQRDEILKRPHVVVATPGRALELLQRNILTLDHLSAIVLDEADLMLGMGFEDQVTRVCDCLPKQVQAALFSATDMELAKHLQERLLANSERIDASSDQQGRHEYLLIPSGTDKLTILLQFLRETTKPDTSGIIFCQTREKVRTLCEDLRDHGISADELSGDLGQIERSTVMRHFKSGGIQYLVATNVASRGIDVKDLSVVINYDLPSTADEYIHRIGRSGRAGKIGWDISLCTPHSRTHLRGLLDSLGFCLEERFVDVADSTTHNAMESLATPTLPTQCKFARLHLNRGKSHKLRPGDVVGTLVKSIGLTGEDVGNIFIYDHFTHIEVNTKLANKVIDGLATIKIKNLRVKATQAHVGESGR